MPSFEELGLSESIQRAVTDLGFEKPTPIQAKVIPQLLDSDQDLIASAQTGTGKTAAFGLPSVQMTDTDDKSTQTLILCPTRELCIQIVKDITSYSKYNKAIGVVAVYGGSSIDTQIQALKRNAQIVVGTPGRTKDLIKRKRLVLSNVRRVVLDEADEMLTMGFKEDLDFILGETPDEKQTLLFSATMSKDIMAVTRKYMDNPVTLAAAKVNMGAENVKHVFYMVQARDKYEVLKRIADINPDIYGIVFCRTRRDTKLIANKLMHDGYNADALHGDLSQAQRDEVMGKFRKGLLQILVATDVAARGLDVDNLTHVINFNLPDDPENYVHRSGRTGRAGKSGVSIAIIHTREMNRIRDIRRRTRIEFEQEQVPTGKDICVKQLYALIDKIVSVKVDHEQIAPFLDSIYSKLETLDREELIKHFISAEFNHFLDYYKNARDLNVKGRETRDGRRETRDGRRDTRDGRRDTRDGRRDTRDGRRSSDAGRRTSFTKLWVNLGSTQEVTPPRLIGIINDALDSSEARIGKIEIMKNASFFGIEQSFVADVLAAMNGREERGVVLKVKVPDASSGWIAQKKSKGSSRKPGSKRRDDKPGSKRKRSSDGAERSGKRRRKKK